MNTVTAGDITPDAVGPGATTDGATTFGDITPGEITASNVAHGDIAYGDVTYGAVSPAGSPTQSAGFGGTSKQFASPAPVVPTAYRQAGWRRGSALPPTWWEMWSRGARSRLRARPLVGP